MSRTKRARTTAAPKPERRLSDNLPSRRVVRATYDAAQTTTENTNHWAAADSLSANAAHSPDVRQKLRNRARYEAANNTYCLGMLRTLANDVIGTGPTLQMMSGDKEDDTEIENAFWKWSVSIRLAEKLRLSRIAMARDGEQFLKFITNYPLRNPVKLDIRPYESEQVAEPTMRAVMDLSDGIILDDFGNVVGYRLLKYHPGDTAFYLNSGEAETVPARDMIHLMRGERSGQCRGVPEISSALPLYAQLRRYTLSVIAAAETAADLAGVIRSSSPTDDPDSLTPLDEIDIVKRTLLTMPEGWDISQLKAEQPVTTYEMFKRAIISEIARCLNMPYNVAAGDSSSYNYSSGRLDHKTYFKSIRVDRFYFEQVVLDTIFARWWEEARLVGVIPDSLRSLREPAEHDWRWDGDEHVDPTKEATAEDTHLKNHTTTYARAYARQGLDWEFEFRQAAKERALMQELGLPLADEPQAAESDNPEDAEATLRDLIETYGIAVRAGAVTPQKEDEDFVRKLVELPPASSQVAKAWKDETTRRPLTLKDKDGVSPSFPPANRGGETADAA